MARAEEAEAWALVAELGALRHEALIPDSPPRLKALHERQAEVQRRSQAHFLTTSALLRRQADQSDTSSEGRRGEWLFGPASIIDAVASLAHSRSVAVGIRTSGGVDLAISSDETARVAHDYEAMLGEGPMRSCRIEGPLQAAKEDFPTRWPIYSAAAKGLDVRHVMAVPMRVGGNILGSLAVFDTPTASTEGDLGGLCRLGEAVVDVLLAEAESIGAESSQAIGTNSGWEGVQQAAGILTVRHRCTIEDAMALVRARAFAEGVDLQTAAQEVIAGASSFDDV